MKAKGYFFFHLNLAFSSIDEGDWPIVIDKCYWPLLNIISDLQLPLGIEMSGWTLSSIQKVCPTWVSELRKYIAEGKCELIGSGYCQMISPLVPYEVNIQNQKIGLECYKTILNVTPKIALVNEMAFSDAVIDLLAEVGYSAFIMDSNNVGLALGGENNLPTFGQGTGAATLPILWAESIMFQKLQQVSHGNISMDDYLTFIAERISRGCTLLPIYSNDAEIFDFRPGRFSAEAATKPEGEWSKLREALRKLSDNLDVEFISPSEAIQAQLSSCPAGTASLTSAGYPVVVKKQPKYNIARWAVTGRDDTWLNTMCFRIYERLIASNKKDDEKWKNICELWSSDLRTHLTEKRWSETNSRIKKTLAVEKVSDQYGIPLNIPAVEIGHPEITLRGFQRRYFGDGIYVELKNKFVNVVLNLRRGLTIEKLAFASHGFESCVGKVPHGFNPSISDGFDYYSGGVVIELPKALSKVTDLVPVNAQYSLATSGALLVKAVIETPFGQIVKVIEISSLDESMKCLYKFNKMKRYIGSVRVGNFTLSPRFSEAFEYYAFHAGGPAPSKLQVDQPFEQSKSATTYVSSSRGFCSTSGKVELNCGSKSLGFSWDNSVCAPLCLLDHSTVKTRLGFSICEFDETSRESSGLGDLCLELSPGTSSGRWLEPSAT